MPSVVGDMKWQYEEHGKWVDCDEKLNAGLCKAQEKELLEWRSSWNGKKTKYRVNWDTKMVEDVENNWRARVRSIEVLKQSERGPKTVADCSRKAKPSVTRFFDAMRKDCGRGRVCFGAKQCMQAMECYLVEELFLADGEVHEGLDVEAWAERAAMRKVDPSKVHRIGKDADGKRQEVIDFRKGMKVACLLSRPADIIIDAEPDQVGIVTTGTSETPTLLASPITCNGVEGPIAHSRGAHPGWELKLADAKRRSYVSLKRGSFDDATLNAWFNELREKVRWLQPSVDGQPLPRSAAWMTRTGCCCKYCYGRTEWDPQPMEPWFLEITRLICEECGIVEEDMPNSCNLNLYEGGKQSVHWHADDEELFDAVNQDALIISFSLGAPRTFWARPADQHTQLTKLRLENGDICTMEGHMQRHYEHAVLKEDGMEGVRINLTWRTVRKHRLDCPARSQASLVQFVTHKVRQGDLKRSRKVGADLAAEESRLDAPHSLSCTQLPAWEEPLHQWLSCALRASLEQDLNDEDMIQAIADGACHLIKMAASFEEGVKEAMEYLIDYSEVCANQLEEQCASLSVGLEKTGHA